MSCDEPRLVWTSLTTTSEHGVKGFCVRGGWRGEGEHKKERAQGVRRRHSRRY
jgi:hypothetical protein